MALDPRHVTRRPTPPADPQKPPESEVKTGESASVTDAEGSGASAKTGDEPHPSSGSESPEEQRVRFTHDAGSTLIRSRVEQQLDAGVAPSTGSGTGDAPPNTAVHSGPSDDGEPVDQVTGEVTIVGQTAEPVAVPQTSGQDGVDYVWYEIEYEVDGETRTGWVKSTDVEADLDWREGDPIRLYDADGQPLSVERANDYRTAAAAQQELEEEYGIVVAPADDDPPPTATNGATFRPLSPDDADAMTLALEQARALEGEGGYGIDLQGHPPEAAWTPEEIGAVYDAVTGVADTMYNRAVEQGYDVDSPQQLFKDVYVCGTAECSETLPIRRLDTTETSRGYYAQNDRYSRQISLSHSAFYASGDVGHVQGSFGPDFTPAELVAHELSHQFIINPGRGVVRVDEDGNELPTGASINPDYTRTGNYVLQSDHVVTYTNDDGEEVQELIPAGTTIDLPTLESGYAFVVRSTNGEDEIETDAITAYTFGRGYSLGADYARDQNLLALARLEQGEAIADEALASVYGPPPPPRFYGPIGGRRLTAE